MNKLPIILISSGLILLIATIILAWVAAPRIIDSQVKKQVLLEEGTETWDKWKDIPIPVYLKFYIFNITNPDEVENGEKPEIFEMGPYIYEEKRNKFDIVALKDRNSVQYRQNTEYIFRPDLSNGSETDSFTMINLPLIAVASIVPDNFLGNLIVNLLIGAGESFFRLAEVREVLFEGMDVTIYNKVLGPRPEFSNNTFGLYKGKNNSDDGLYEVRSGASDVSEFGNIVTYNGASSLDYWPGETCNMINGTDGSIFPPFVKKDRILKLFNTELCRSLYLTFEKESKFQGIPSYRFTPPKEMLEDPLINSDNLCFCQKENGTGCLGAGAIPLSVCQNGVPAAGTLPHFLDGDIKYLEATKGLAPSRELHETFVELEPRTGVVLIASKRIQINLDVKRKTKIKFMQNVTEMLFPVLWADETAEMDEENIDTIKSNLLTPLKIIDISKWVLIGISIIIGGAGVILFIRMKKSKETV